MIFFLLVLAVLGAAGAMRLRPHWGRAAHTRHRPPLATSLERWRTAFPEDAAAWGACCDPGACVSPECPRGLS